jgi:hypothetical protein
MKKTFILFGLVVFLSMQAVAQGGFRLGVKGGLNLNKVNGQSFNDVFDMGYMAGAFAEIDINKFIGIQPELLYSQTMTKRSSFSTLYNTRFSQSFLIDNAYTRLNYLSIPILLRLNLGKLITFNAGPQYGILIGQDKNVLNNAQNAFKSGDISAVVGAQLNLSSFRIYGRYIAGLQNINAIDDMETWKTASLQLGIGLKF